MVHDTLRAGSVRHGWRSGVYSAKPIRYAGPLVAALLVCTTEQASDASLQGMRTDANLITAIDVSDSIGRHEEWLQQTGLVRALLHPGFLDAATAGPNRRIGFAVFTWSSDGRFDVLVPWTIIGSAEDASRVSAAIASLELVDPSRYGGGDHEDRHSGDGRVDPDRLTDISGAIDHASILLTSAPFETDRSVMNICANGIDNAHAGSDDGVEESRDRALSLGLTINGLVVGSDAGIIEYFSTNVMGGPGAFIMELSSPSEAGQIMAEKFRRDLLAAVAIGESPTGP
jgi:Ca-activated chloride channel family protein